MQKNIPLGRRNGIIQRPIVAKCCKNGDIKMATVNDVNVCKPDDDQSQQCKAWPIWSCGASEFDWDYTQTETCLILEGKVTVTDRPDSGESVTFGPGDMVVFPVGLKCIWKVTEPVKKHYDFS
jgi:uncharacterized cupin superfamily protein